MGRAGVGLEAEAAAEAKRVNAKAAKSANEKTNGPLPIANG